MTENKIPAIGDIHRTELDYSIQNSIMCKKQSKQETPVEEINYPRYLSNHPKGADLFEGKSQERLAQAVAAHITEVDKITEEGKQPTLARLIGLEGKWGSGKSNVISILQKDCLSDYYIFFNFDAWGNQEDLQRRSILELLTKYLIDTGKLTGMTKMRVMKPEGEGKVEEIPCTWKVKLESLLSRKSYTRDITVPSFNGWSKAFVLMLLITGLLIPLLDLVAKDALCWWVHLTIVVGPILVFLLIAWVTGNICPMWRMYNTEGKSDTTSFVISEQEPSVHEFKEWMTEVSKGLPQNEKLVLVFDNMDRLPSDKVHQFWSLIQTFFADDGYNNIWCIIPYDESHLAAVFSDGDSEDKRVKLLRGFLNKTFPVVYRVPEPIVADYKIIFEMLFREAFGTWVDDDNLELISQCYRYANPVPNVREIVTFINNNVMLAKQWKETISPVSRAVFVLKEDAILRNAKIKVFNHGKWDVKDATTDEYILNNEYYTDFRQILMGNVKLHDMQREIAAMVYGIAPDNADQIVIKRYIRNCINGEAKDGSLTKYVMHPLFMLLLLEDVKAMSPVEYEKAAQLINEIDSSTLQPGDQKRLANIWRFLAKRFLLNGGVANNYSAYERTLFIHVDEEMAKKCVMTLCQRLIDNKEVSGATLFSELNKIFSDDYAKPFVPSEVCPSVTIEAKRFADFVQSGKAEYNQYPLRSNKDELNQFFKESLGDTFSYIEALELLKEDKDYSVIEVGKYAIEQLNLKKVNAESAANLIAVQRVFYDKFQSTLDTNYINNLWQTATGGDRGSSYDEIFALKASYTNEQLQEDSAHIDVLMKKVLFYTTTTQIFKNYLANTNIIFRRNLLKKMIIEQKHDNTPDFLEFIGNWQTLINTLGVTKENVIRFAESWGYKEIPEQIRAKKYFDVLGDAAWTEVLLAEETPLSKALLSKCVEDMSVQPITQFIAANTANHANTNWDKALQKLVGTDYIRTDMFGKMTEIAEYLLDFVAKNGPVNDVTWNTLLDKVSYAAISSKVNDIRNRILNGVSGYTMTAAKFQFLHEWLERADINSESHCSDTANQILSKVVDDEASRNIILGKKDYYRPIIAKTVDTASALHDKLRIIIEKQGDSEFAAYIRENVDYGKKKD